MESVTELTKWTADFLHEYEQSGVLATDASDALLSVIADYQARISRGEAISLPNPQGLLQELEEAE